MRKGFTLLEILVVISILGVFASVVLVSLSAAKARAQIAAAQQFETSVYHAVGDTVRGLWNLNSVTLSGGSSGNGTAADSTGSNNNLNLYSVTLDPLTPDGSGQAISFAGNSGSYAQTANQINITAPLTLSAWIKTTSNPVDTTIMSVPIGFSELDFVLTFGQPTVFIPLANSSVQSVGASPRKLNDGKWHQVSWTFDNSTRKYAFFEDGKLDSAGTIPSDAVTFGSHAVTIGTGAYGSFTGSMDNVSMYNSYIGQ